MSDAKLKRYGMSAMKSVELGFPCIDAYESINGEWVRFSDIDPLLRDLQKARKSVRDAAELLLAINKDMHARNPMAVTAIDMWLAERGIEPTSGDGGAG